MTGFRIRPLESGDREWVAALIAEHWGSEKVVTRGLVHDVRTLDGLVALQDEKPAGLLMYRIEGDELEIVTLDSLREGIGVGSALIGASREMAEDAGCRRIWLITTNDNLAAVRFYQKRGFFLVAVYPNALEQSRKLKPEIPLAGIDDIPLRDEIELELLL
jgi:ribosomal protein S18 acetylase RimI-like enzyme